MLYRCENCGGNVIYEPEKGTMYCPYCDSLDSEKKITEARSLEVCPNCGGTVTVDSYTSASQCPYCSSYLIFDERVEGTYEPHFIIPFKISRKQAENKLKEHFKSKIFIPSDFYSEAKLKGMHGRYVPFWLYDYNTECQYEAEGTKVRTWRMGDTEYTETSYYRVIRDMTTEFERVPADDSIAMEDSVMDLLEPYHYQDLKPFQTEYMSGFFGELYNQGADVMESRAKEKVKEDVDSLLQTTISGYTTLVPTSKQVTVDRKCANYTLLPAWVYNYQFGGKNYQFHINGQTGKIIGAPPISIGKVFAYGLTLWAGMTGILVMLRMILSGM